MKQEQAQKEREKIQAEREEQKKSRASASSASSPSSLNNSAAQLVVKEKGNLISKLIIAVILLVIIGGGVLFYPEYQKQQQLQESVHIMQKNLDLFISDASRTYTQQSNFTAEFDTLSKLNGQVDLLIEQYKNTHKFNGIKAKILFSRFERQFAEALSKKDVNSLNNLVKNNSQKISALNNKSDEENEQEEQVNVENLINLMKMSQIMLDFKRFSWQYPIARQDVAKKPQLLAWQELQAKKLQFIDLKKGHDMFMVTYPIFKKVVDDTANRELPLLDAWGKVIK